MSNFNSFYQPTIWESKCSICEIYDSCGGSNSAPCGCIKTGDDRYHCSKCTILCKERCSSIDKRDIFSAHVRDVLKLNDLCIKQDFNGTKYFPLFIPTQTRQLPENVCLSWAGVSITDLVNKRRKPPVSTKKYLNSDSSFRKNLRINEQSNLIVIMNSQDDLLEHFWASDRNDFYNSITNRIFAASGPTFSIYKETKNKEREPDSHKVLMNMRQNQVLQEMNNKGINAIPNIYWRNKKDRMLWAEWLNKNTSVWAISRDFSSTRSRDGVDYKNGLNYLIDIVRAVNRRMHIFVNGISYKKAASVIEKFAEIGCTCSCITSNPIILGRKGIKLEYRGSDIPDTSHQGREILAKDIAFSNICVMQDYLNKFSSSFSIYSDSPIISII